jgi:hypothetical protein
MASLANIILENYMYRMKALLGLMLAGFMGAAAAAAGPGYLGDLVGQNVSINNTISGLGTPITDVYSFDIGSTTSETIATAVKVNLQYGSSSTPIYDIINFAITLLDTDGMQYAFDNSFDGNGALELSAVLAPSMLGAPGFYQVVVTGTTARSAGGIYAGALSATPVPEPKDWMLMLAGIGLVGMMVGRVKRYIL